MTLGPVSTHAYPRCLLQRLHRRVRRNPVQYVQFGQGALFIPHSFFVLTPYPSHRARPSRHLHRFDRIKSFLSAYGRTPFNSTASYLRIVSADYNPHTSWPASPEYTLIIATHSEIHSSHSILSHSGYYVRETRALFPLPQVQESGSLGEPPFYPVEARSMAS